MTIAYYILYIILGLLLATLNITIWQAIAIILLVAAIDINSFGRAYGDFKNGR